MDRVVMPTSGFDRRDVSDGLQQALVIEPADPFQQRVPATPDLLGCRWGCCPAGRIILFVIRNCANCPLPHLRGKRVRRPLRFEMEAIRASLRDLPQMAQRCVGRT